MTVEPRYKAAAGRTSICGVNDKEADTRCSEYIYGGNSAGFIPRQIDGHANYRSRPGPALVIALLSLFELLKSGIDPMQIGGGCDSYLHSGGSIGQQ